MRWGLYLNWATKHRPVMKLAARLGRSRGRARWLDHVRPLAPAPRQPDLTHWDRHEAAGIWLGHATVLLRLGGLNILTDPVFSPRVGLGLGFMTGGPRRLIAPALALRELPPLDLILVSHAHFDHLDIPSLHRLGAHVPIITSEHNGDLIRGLGHRHVTELRWNEATDVGGVRVTARRVNHWGARTVYDQHRGFAGFLLEAPHPRRGRARRILFGGDTAYHEYFQDIERVDLAVLGIGAYDPWIASHANPEQAWSMAQHMGADFILPIHHSTFQLSREPRGQPLERLLETAGAAEQRVAIRQIGGLWAA